MGKSKLFLAGALALTLLTGTGCISTYVVKTKARPHFEMGPADERPRPVDGEPGYYALLPLTIAADIATVPFQLFYFGDSHWSHASIDGWPIPVP